MEYAFMNPVLQIYSEVQIGRSCSVLSAQCHSVGQVCMLYFGYSFPRRL